MAIDSFGICQQYTDFVDGPMFESSYRSCRYPRALRRDDQSIRAGHHTDSLNRSQSLVGQVIQPILTAPSGRARNAQPDTEKSAIPAAYLFTTKTPEQPHSKCAILAKV